MRAFLLAGIGWLLASAAHAQAPACEPVPGAEALWAKPETRFVVFGEYHGTAEIPALFTEIVCQALRSGRPVSVALEIEPEKQPALDAYLAGSNVRLELPGSDDGRRSQAMAEMLERLRSLRTSGADLQVFATRRWVVESGQSGTEHAIAEAWREVALRRPEALVLALVGNIHALKSGKPRDLSFTPAAAYLPPEATLAVLTTLPGGAIWACRGEAPCGAGELKAYGAQLPRGVHLRPEPGMDGRFSVGRPFSPSPPMVR